MKLRMWLRCLLLLFVSALATPICQAAETPSEKSGLSIESVVGREWRIQPPAEDYSQTWPHRRFVRRVQPYIGLVDGAIKGSSGCGTLTGAYHGSGSRISMTVKWVDDLGKCDAADQNDASQIVASLNSVQKIIPAPEYWDDDALFLGDGKDKRKIILSPMKAGGDLLDLEDTFWRLSSLDGKNMESSDIVIWIAQGQVSFSTLSYFVSYPFRYKLAGLRFSPAWRYGYSKTDLARNQKFTSTLEASLHRIAAYRPEREHLILSDERQSPFMVFSRLPKTGLEARRWRIARYRLDESETNQSGLVDAKAYAEITFLHDGVYGSPGCGGWFGNYKLDHDILTTKAGYVLGGACSGTGEAQNGPVVSNLNGTLRVEHHGDTVILRGLDGRESIELIEF